MEASRRRGGGGMVRISPLQTTRSSDRAVRNPRLGEGNFRGKHDKDGGVNVQVIVRCRPLSEDDEVRLHAPAVISCNDSRREVCTVQSVANKQIDRTFLFDKVFGPSSQQKDLYDQAVRPIVFEVLEGYNSTIFAYGQTGTGKTYTMEGGSGKKNGDIPSDAGVIPRAIRQIFDILEAKKAEYSLKVTFLELYNEEITDLLAPKECSKFVQDKSKKPIALLEDGKGGIFVRGLEEETVKTAEEIYNILEKGSAKRRTAETLLNKQSSRSHSVFSITIHIKECTPHEEKMIKCGKLNLVDLAGSENISRSGAREERAREAGEINKSLLTLGRVINALVEHSVHIPYRDSKLTRLLKDSLGGETKTCIIATISPSSHCLEGTLSTLDYAHRAKNIKKKPEVNQKMIKSVLIKDFYFEIDRLKQEVHVTREKNEIYVPKDHFLKDEAEKKVMLENIERMEIVKGNKHLASERTWKLLNHMSLFCSPKLRKDKIEDTDRVLIQKFQSELAQQLEILHKAIASATTTDEIYMILEKGSAKRRTSETLLNKHNSRSNSVFSINLHINECTPEGEEMIICGNLNLVDLAGSENISRSGAREGRAREAGEINKSLLTLGRVINALVEHYAQIPYREQALGLREDLETAESYVSILFAKIERKDNIEDNDRVLIQKFQSKLVQQHGILYKAVASATTQQEHHLKAMEKDMHLFVSSKIEATKQLQDQLEKLKSMYGSGIKTLGDFAGELDGNSQSERNGGRQKFKCLESSLD
ncbi:kinesin-like protein KIN-5D [Salvia splendens]|uniref:kinesin-like protein KIN-5D n=1 Tax=Salvia splendens TaxID=180675 RepID=UPI001C25467D|nr:kinesin-like protein KIN-5D [Salvia splendens]